MKAKREQAKLLGRGWRQARAIGLRMKAAGNDDGRKAKTYAGSSGNV